MKDTAIPFIEEYEILQNIEMEEIQETNQLQQIEQNVKHIDHNLFVEQTYSEEQYDIHDIQIEEIHE